MNRLILIGNGFDLAHGLKTSYKDFVIGYLTDCFYRTDPYFFNYDDELLSIEISHPLSFKKFIRSTIHKPSKSFLIERSEIHDFFEFCYQNSILWYLFSRENGEISTDATLDGPKSKLITLIRQELSIQINSGFFLKIIKYCLDNNWVDIEQEYFNALKKYNDKDNAHDLDYIKTLNKHFKYLKIKLEEYLTIQDQNFDDRSVYQLGKLLGQEFQENDFDPSIGDDELRIILGKDYSVENNKTQRKVYVLNFNYTNTFYNYITEIKGNYFTQVEINHIHGQLNNKYNPIIFGFGDEHDKDYALFEEQSNNDLFEHVKSYHYLKTPNYRHLMRFLNADHYQVFVVGHSCGLSDRTMFKEIFDHENCKSVKILHHKREDGTTDFFDKTINLGRHFSDKGRMRKLVVNFNESDAIPQMNKEI